jgi:hypothetical protein
VPIFIEQEANEKLEKFITRHDNDVDYLWSAVDESAADAVSEHAPSRRVTAARQLDRPP